MRKLLLASAGILAFAASAQAAGTDSVNINATVAQSCSIDLGPDVNLSSGAASSTWTLTCNFVGDIGATVGSANGGLLGAGPGGLIDYVITVPGVGSSNASDLEPAISVTAPGAATGTASNIPVSFSVDLTGALADTYTDTLTVSVTP